jgi:hypothetical protein
MSVEITGTSTKGEVTVPFTLTATREEEIVAVYGDRKQVATPKWDFRDDGKQLAFGETPPGFGQLDVTGLFLVAQVQQRPVSVDLPAPVTVKGVPAFRIRVSNSRNRLHFGVSRVQDELDIYVTEAGLLAATSRLYYDDQPFRYTESHVFSDYRRDDNGTILPYRIEVYLKGRLVETLQVSAYHFTASACGKAIAPNGLSTNSITLPPLEL